MWRERKRRRRRWRKYGHASGIRDLLNVGFRREGEYDLEQALPCVGGIIALDTLSVFTGLKVTYTPHYLER